MKMKQLLMPFFSFKDYRSASERSILPPVRHHLDIDHHLVTGSKSVKDSRKKNGTAADTSSNSPDEEPHRNLPTAAPPLTEHQDASCPHDGTDIQNTNEA